MKIKEILAAEKEKKQKKNDLFYTGLTDVDMVIGGVAPGEIMLISSPPSLGATAFCIPAALFSAVKNSLKTIYLTSERPVYLAKRLAGVDTSAPLCIEPIEGVSLDEIDEAIPSEMELIFQKYAYEEPPEESERMEPVDKYTREIPAWLLILDSLDYVYKYYPKQGDHGALRCELFQNAVKEIKRLAQKYNAAVIITADALKSNLDGSAELSREVASCAPLVECLCLLDRDREEYRGKAILEVLKNVKFVKAEINLGIDQESRLLIDFPGESKS